MFFWNSLAFLMFQRMLVIWPLVPLPFLNPAWTSGISWFMCCWSLTWRILTDLSKDCPSWHDCWLPQNKWSNKKWVNSDLTLQCLHKSISEVTYSYFNYILFIKNASLNSDLTQEEGIYFSSLEAKHIIVFVSASLDFPGNSSVKNPEFACNAGDPNSIPGLGSSPGEGISYPLQYSWPSQVAPTVKNLPAMQETWVQSLDWEDSLKEGMATHSSILSWRIPMDRGAWQATVHGVTKSQTQLSK